MIVEAGWEEKGVRLTWKYDPAVQFVGFAAEELRKVEQEARGGFWELQCPHERAIRIVASRDPEKRGGTKAEWNHQFEEMLVDGVKYQTWWTFIKCFTQRVSVLKAPKNIEERDLGSSICLVSTSKHFHRHWPQSCFTLVIDLVPDA